ncbi:Lrp/AsnC family transcriptional regulator [Sphingopyxis panaciterrae]
MNRSNEEKAPAIPEGLDTIDRRIVSELLVDGRIPNAELARRVGLSPSPCWKRVRALEERGVIVGYEAKLGFDTIGLKLCMLVQVTLEKHASDAMDGFAEAVARMPEVVEASMVAGDFDYLLKVRTADTHAYERFLREKLHRIAGVRQVRSILVLGN